MTGTPHPTEEKRERILCVDDDPQVLAAYERLLRKQFDFTLRADPLEAVSLLGKDNSFAVIVADMRMPKLNGVELLQRAQELAPDTVRMMLTGMTELETALQAVNSGNVFKLATKPCPAPDFARILNACIDQHRLLRSRHELLSKTLSGSVKLITDILGNLDNERVGRGMRVRPILRSMCDRMSVSPIWPIELAAVFADLGLLLIPQELRAKADKQEPLTPEELDQYNNSVLDASRLLRNIPHLENVARIVLYHKKNYDGTGYPRDNVQGERIPIESRVLKAVLDWDDLLASGLPEDLALADIAYRRDEYDPIAFETLSDILELQGTRVVRTAYLDETTEEMMLAEDLKARNGYVICKKGLYLTSALKVRLRNTRANLGIIEPFRVFAPIEASDKLAAADSVGA